MPTTRGRGRGRGRGGGRGGGRGSGGRGRGGRGRGRGRGNAGISRLHEDDAARLEERRIRRQEDLKVSVITRLFTHSGQKKVTSQFFSPLDPLVNVLYKNCCVGSLSNIFHPNMMLSYH